MIKHRRVLKNNFIRKKLNPNTINSTFKRLNSPPKGPIKFNLKYNRKQMMPPPDRKSELKMFPFKSNNSGHTITRKQLFTPPPSRHSKHFDIVSQMNTITNPNVFNFKYGLKNQRGRFVSPQPKCELRMNKVPKFSKSSIRNKKIAAQTISRRNSPTNINPTNKTFKILE